MVVKNVYLILNKKCIKFLTHAIVLSFCPTFFLFAGRGGHGGERGGTFTLQARTGGAHVPGL